MKVLFTFLSFLIFFNNTKIKKNQSIVKSNVNNFTSFWNEFVKIVSNEKINTKMFNGVSSNILDCNEKKIKLSTFIKTDLTKVFDTKIKSKIKSDQNLSFYESDMESIYFEGFMIDDLSNYKIKKVSIVKNGDSDGNPEILELCFIQTKKGYKFFGYKTYG